MEKTQNLYQPVTNFRDLFFSQFQFSDQKSGVIYRSGKLLELFNSQRIDVVGQFKTIINFCPEPDKYEYDHTENKLSSFNQVTNCEHLRSDGINFVHIPYDGPDRDVYNSRDKAIQLWITNVISAIATALTKSCFPILLHCFSGKDRTGIIAAAILLLSNCSDEDVIRDYSYSDGRLHINEMRQFVNTFSTLILPRIPPDVIRAIQQIGGGMTRNNSILRIGYLPTLRNIHYQQFNWKIDACGRLIQVNTFMRFHSLHLTLFQKGSYKLLKEYALCEYEKNNDASTSAIACPLQVRHCECIHNDIINRTPSDAWVPIVPFLLQYGWYTTAQTNEMASPPVTSRINEFILSQAGRQHYITSLKQIIQAYMTNVVLCTNNITTDNEESLLCNAKVAVPIEVTLTYNSMHGVQRPDIVNIRCSIPKFDADELLEFTICNNN